MTDENSSEQRTSLLVVFGCMFTTVGLSIGVVDSYGLLSWIFLGLGVLLPLAAIVLATTGNNASGEVQQNG